MTSASGARSQPGASEGARLSHAQRRIVAGVAASGVLLITLTASFNYVLGSMVADLDATESQTDTLRQIPSIAAVLVVFLAGVLGERLGERRVLWWSGLLFAAGSLIVTLSPTMPIATAGMLLAYIGKAAALVVGIAYLSASISGKHGRASAFGTYSSVQPLAYVVMPVLAGLLIGAINWRAVGVVWVICGLAASTAVWRLLPRSKNQGAGRVGEMLTPALAGVALAAAIQLITLVPNEGVTGRTTLYAAVFSAALGLLWWSMKRIEQPSLHLEPLRHGGLLLLLAVSGLMLFANLIFYMTMALQYIFGLSSLEVAFALMPAQLSTIVAAKLSGRIIQRRGLTFAGTSLILLTAAALGASAFVELTTPLWVCSTIVALYAAALVGAGVAVTNAVMDLAPPQESGSASSLRSAASDLGLAIGVAGMTAIVFSSAAASLDQQSVAAGLDPSESSQVATAMRDGATSEDAASLYAVPVTQVDEITEFQRRAYLEGFKAHGVVGAVVTLGTAGVYYFARRRIEAHQHLPVAPSPAA